MILEAKAFDTDGRMRYLMKKRTEVDRDHDPLSTSTPKGKRERGDLTLVEEFNLTGGVKVKAKWKNKFPSLWSTFPLTSPHVGIQLHKRKLLAGLEVKRCVHQDPEGKDLGIKMKNLNLKQRFLD